MTARSQRDLGTLWLALATVGGLGVTTAALAAATYADWPSSRLFCELGDPGECFNLGQALEKRGEHVLAKAFWTRSCNARLGRGCALVGIHMEDPARALTFLEEACTLKDGYGCYRLGLALATADPTRATAAYREGVRDE